MIPKIIHQIWWNIGNGNLPDNYVKYSNKWKERYPDFEYKLWNQGDCMKLIKKNIIGLFLENIKVRFIY